ncbi:MAG TPA: PA14 domain-containing protein, partial [Planctomycetota bacterium]|nr:PA14 domain-containing protein [Planctomycetota bacterium]
YYTGTNFQTLSLSRTDPTVNFSWAGSPGTGVPADNFSVRWTGFVTAQTSETYTFTTRSDDGVRLWVNGQQLVNNWTYHGATDNSGQIALVAGQSYPIQIDFFEGTELAVAQLSWATPTIAKQIVPQSQLSPTAPPVMMKASVPVDATATFQALLDAAVPGDTVTLGSGSFVVAGGLFVPAGVSLKGAGPGRTILHGAGSPAVVRLLGGPSDASSIVEGMSLTGGGAGLMAGSASALLSHLVIARNTASGVVSEAGGLLSAVHVTVADNGGDGLLVSGAVVIRNSIVSGNGGFGVVAPSGAAVTYSDVFGNASGPGVSGGADLPMTFLDPAALDYRASPGSATIDEADPADPVDAEPSPNGGRANQGAYGNTIDAEPSPLLSKSSAPLSAASSSGGGCGATGLEALVLAGLLAVARRRRR